MASPAWLRLTIHIIMAVISIFYFIQVKNLTKEDISIFLIFWNQHVFLTNLTHFLIIIYYLWTIVQDIQGIFIQSKSSDSTSSAQIHEYKQSTHTYYQFILSLSMVVGVGYWSIVLYDQNLLFGGKNPDDVNFYYLMYYLHGCNHLILYAEIFLYRQHVFVTHKQKSIINAFGLGFYFLITAIHYFYFGKIVYAFQNEGLSVMISIYALSILAFVIFDYGFSEIATKIKLFHVDSKLLQSKHKKIH